MPEKTEKTEKAGKNYPFYQNPGDKFMEIHKWDETGKNLVVSEKIDIQDEIDKRSKGMTIGEQLNRLSQGDLSVFKAGDPQYGDFSKDPETMGEYIMKGQEIARKSKADSFKSLEEIKTEIDKMEEGDKKSQLQKEYEIALVKMQTILGKE